MIDPAAVENAFADALADTDGLVVDGIVHGARFDVGRLEAHRDEVVGWIAALPTEFLASDEGGGGGWSFLNLCTDRETGDIWTGLHLRCEQLYLLAAGLGLASILLPRDLWQALPGGVPYLQFRTTTTGHPSSPESGLVSRSGSQQGNK